MTDIPPEDINDNGQYYLISEDGEFKEIAPEIVKMTMNWFDEEIIYPSCTVQILRTASRVKPLWGGGKTSRKNFFSATLKKMNLSP